MAMLINQQRSDPRPIGDYRHVPNTGRARANAACTVSIVIPVFNEFRTVGKLLRRALASPYSKEIIIVDDGSTDGTAECLRRFRGCPGVEIVTHATNRGKGAAIRTALQLARGRFTLIQDADLEYDPADYPRVLEPLMRREAQVVYGSRYLHGGNHQRLTAFSLGVKALNVLVWLLYGARISDQATCYKAFDTNLLKSLDLRCDGFEFCPEVTAKLLMRGVQIHEVPIRYRSRTKAEGKKLRYRDGIMAAWCLIRCRFLRAAALPPRSG